MENAVMPESVNFNETERSPRLALPYLFPAQAHKEVTHNASLAKIDMLVAPVVEGVADSPVDLSPAAGQCWLVSDNPTGQWAGCNQHIAGWSGSEWVFQSPWAGLQVYARETGNRIFFVGGQWQTFSAPAFAEGGAVVDEQSRAVLSTLISTLRAIGVFTDPV